MTATALANAPTKKEPFEVEDTCHGVEDHEFMFIEKEESELDESEDLESVVQAVLLQSAELAAQANESSENAETQILKAENQNAPSFKSETHPQFLTIDATSPVIRATVSTPVSVVDFVPAKTSLNNLSVPNIFTIQSQSRSSLETTTVPSQVSNITDDPEHVPTLMQVEMLQNTLHTQTTQAPAVEKGDMPQLNVPKVRNEQNMVCTSQIFDKTQKMNMDRTGMNQFSSNNPPLEVIQNKLRMAMLQTQMATFGVPKYGFNLPSTNTPEDTLSQNTGTPPSRVPPLAKPQKQSLAVRIEFLKNVRNCPERPVAPAHVGNVPRFKPLQKMTEVPHLSSFCKPRASHIGSQQRVLMTNAQQTIQHNSKNLKSVQQRTSISIPSATGQFRAASVPQLSGNGSQFNMPQLHIPQLVANPVRSHLTLAPSAYVHPQGLIQPLFPPQPRIPQLANLQQQIAANAQGLNVAHISIPGPHLGVTPLTTNVQMLNVPQIAANVPTIYFPQVAANTLKFTGNVLPINAPYLPTSLSRPSVPLVAMSNVAQLGVPHFTNAVPTLPLPQLSPNIPQFSVPQYPANISCFGLQSGVSNLVANPLPDSPSVGLHPSRTSVNFQDVIARATHLANTIPKRPSNFLLMTAAESHADTAFSTLSTSSCLLQNGPKGFQEPRNAKAAVKKKSDMMPKKMLQTNLQHEGVSQHGNRKPQKITGVLQLQAGMLQHSANTSQQLASVRQQTKSRKHIISHSETCQNQRKKQKSSHMMKLLQKKQVKHQIALLSLWKRFEKYHIGRSLFDVNRKKLREVRRRHLKIQQNQLNHQTDN